VLLPYVPVVARHLDETSFLSHVRARAVRAPHYRLADLQQLDERLTAHIDAMLIANDTARQLSARCDETSVDQTCFAQAAIALETRDPAWIEAVVERVRLAPALRRPIISAIGWVEPDRLQGVMAAWLDSGDAVRRLVAVSACAAHRVDPGFATRELLRDKDAPVKARALKAAGELGAVDQLASESPFDGWDAACAFWASWSAVLHGRKGAALTVVAQEATGEGPHSTRAMTILLQLLTIKESRHLLEQMVEAGRPLRWVLRCAGVSGDVSFVPWIIGQMADPSKARLAGESVALLTGADADSLSGSRPEDFESGPNDDPDDPNVDMDPDDGLPWPDVKKVEAWWHANEHRFQKGTRYFMGQPVTKEHCIHVLKTGYQRQRILAAQYLCLLEPGTPLFNTAAPAWRQQRLLAAM